MQEFVVCPICNRKLKQITKQHLDTHNISVKEFKERFPNTKTRSESYNEKYRLTSKQKAIKNLEKRRVRYYKNPKLCEYCNSPISYEKRGNRFCDQEECKKKANSIGGLSVKGTKIIKCKFCGKEKEVKKRCRAKYICDECRVVKTRKRFTNIQYSYCEYCGKFFIQKAQNKRNFCLCCIKGQKHKHWLDSQFSFPLKKYPKEFDFDLIRKYGWYCQKTNKNGITRDHIISVMFGFQQNIPTEILKHPANCRLCRHKENQSKGIKSIITYQELLERIEEWNIKYS